MTMMLALKYLIFIFSIVSIQAKIVLIDPGHGGEDCGAQAKHWVKKTLKIDCEKDIALSLAKKIKEYVNKDGRHTAYLTRFVDKTLTLDGRSKLADKIKADIFVSIHLNAAPNQEGHGFETYYLDNHDDVAIKKVEDVENKDVSGEQKLINKILADLVVERVAPQSKQLGQSVHSELAKVLPKKYKMKDRGLKPGLFYVLALSKRPAILLEAGFLTNKKEAKIMRNSWFHRVYAKYVAKGIINYLNKNTEPNLF